METLKRMFTQIRNKYIITLFLVATCGGMGLWLIDVSATTQVQGGNQLTTGLFTLSLETSYHLGLFMAFLSILFGFIFNLARKE